MCVYLCEIDKCIALNVWIDTHGLLRRGCRTYAPITCGYASLRVKFDFVRNKLVSKITAIGMKSGIFHSTLSLLIVIHIFYQGWIYTSHRYLQPFIHCSIILMVKHSVECHISLLFFQSTLSYVFFFISFFFIPFFVCSILYFVVQLL